MPRLPKLIPVILAVAVGAAVILVGFQTREVSRAGQEQRRVTESASSLRSFPTSTAAIPKTDAEWRLVLNSEQYYILRQKGTERPYSSLLEFEKRPGTYVTADCGEPVFRSEQKYDSGTGWPSFYAPINENALVFKEDTKLAFETRTEVLSKCGGHLGHVFDDGPPPTGKRYCMNGDALLFIPDKPVATAQQKRIIE